MRAYVPCAPVRPYLELSVTRPNGGERGVGFALEEDLLEDLAGGVVRQWVRQDGLEHEHEVDEALEARGVQVVGDDLAAEPRMAIKC